MNRAAHIITILGLAAGMLAGCASPTPTPPPTPTPTATPTPLPPTPTPTATPTLSVLPPLTLPADESPHAYLVEWWYFNAHLASEQERFTLHDVIFRIREPVSGVAAHVRHIGIGGADGYATAELFSPAVPVETAQGDFALAAQGTIMTGERGERYTLRAEAGGYAYDLTLRATSEPLLHTGDGLVDFDQAGITYYYTRPRLTVSGTLTPPGGAPTSVTGTAWLDKQWGDFQPVAVEWDWASVQLDDGTDLMLSSLYEREGTPIERYATLRRPGQAARTLSEDEFSFTPGEPVWRSPETGTAYRTHWNVAIPAEGLALVLRPLEETSEFRGETIGVTYWEAGVDVLNASGEVVGQGFVELNWARGRER